MRFTPPDMPPGGLRAVLRDGSCYECMRGPRDRTKVTPYRPTFDDAELLRSTRALLGYWQARQRRGVPAEGRNPSALVKPGLFLQEVP